MEEGKDSRLNTLPSQLTGVEVKPELARRPVLAVMFDNHPDARPQNGLDSAGIVFEAVTEGGITRYLAFYQENLPEEVGSVRSLRPLFVDLVTGFDASVAHVGGSAEALQLVEEQGTKSLSQFNHDEPYYRNNDKQPPHNMYASTKKLQDLQQELGHGSSKFSKIPRSSDKPNENPNAQIITINFSSPDYQTEFHYQKKDNTYQRYLAGEPHVDYATGKVITVKNVVVLRLPVGNVFTESGGEGETQIFNNGKVENVRWRKDSYQNSVILIDDNNKQVPLNRGDTWFAVLPKERPVNY